MKAHTASLLNAVILILCSVWVYWAISGASLSAHIAAVLTLLVLIALYMLFTSALESGDIARIARSGLMTLA